MQISIPWSTNPQNRYGNEYNIAFDKFKNNFDNLFDFVSKYKDIRFNIQSTNLEYNQMEALDNINHFIFFKIPFDYKIIKEMKLRNLKFFFIFEDAPSSLTLLEEQILLGCTDIYVCDDLCYNLKNVKKICEESGIKTRIILNRIPSKRFDKGINPKAPVFTPECIDKLSEYIDIAEIEENTWAKITTLYKIWFERKEWREDLEFIYPELRIYIPNESLIPNFMEYKMNCGYKCGHGSSCKKCEQFIEIARGLKEKNIEYVKEN